MEPQPGPNFPGSSQQYSGQQQQSCPGATRGSILGTVQQYAVPSSAWPQAGPASDSQRAARPIRTAESLSGLLGSVPKERSEAIDNRMRTPISSRERSSVSGRPRCQHSPAPQPRRVVAEQASPLAQRNLHGVHQTAGMIRKVPRRSQQPGGTAPLQTPNVAVMASNAPTPHRLRQMYPRLAPVRMLRYESYRDVSADVYVDAKGAVVHTRPVMLPASRRFRPPLGQGLSMAGSEDISTPTIFRQEANGDADEREFKQMSEHVAHLVAPETMAADEGLKKEGKEEREQRLIDTAKTLRHRLKCEYSIQCLEFGEHADDKKQT